MINIKRQHAQITYKLSNIFTPYASEMLIMYYY